MCTRCFQTQSSSGGTCSRRFKFLAHSLPYVRKYNPLLIRNRSWILTIHKFRILRKKPLQKTFLNFKKWVKSIQTAGYNGARTVYLALNVTNFWAICEQSTNHRHEKQDWLLNRAKMSHTTSGYPVIFQNWTFCDPGHQSTSHWIFDLIAPPRMFVKNPK